MHKNHYISAHSKFILYPVQGHHQDKEMVDHHDADHNVHSLCDPGSYDASSVSGIHRGRQHAYEPFLVHADPVRLRGLRLRHTRHSG